jgi:hypothetical protein
MIGDLSASIAGVIFQKTVNPAKVCTIRSVALRICVRIARFCHSTWLVQIRFSSELPLITTFIAPVQSRAAEKFDIRLVLV